MRAGEALSRIGEGKPLVHHLTNYVTVNLVANTTLSVGALPVMAHSHEEVEEMVGLASALVVNIGTLDPAFVEPCCSPARGPTRGASPWSWIR